MPGQSTTPMAGPCARGRTGWGTVRRRRKPRREAVRVFRESASLGPAEIIRKAHAALWSTRGAALAVARIDRERGEVRFAGVGNISGVILMPR